MGIGPDADAGSRVSRPAAVDVDHERVGPEDWPYGEGVV
jgi:hypothetical protein